ncbi:0106b3c7-0b0c-40b5-9981-48b060b37be4 [Thermothielavioides terrestris]|uniref:0106b3c7-0b0c-40b5-9981-48b060b37be4 n=1 Tax=Thermothielavioides terrestris TaxID=2587410 RepID=A0A3S4EX66_9PEZI|nr:0106b3c7-0b0c-40b5-9981-48b060b37be4 [Thermothielavioides terrestris]
MALSCYRQLENITLGQILCTTAPVLAGFAREAAGLAAQGQGAAQLGWKTDPEMKARSLKALAEDLEAIYSSVRFHSSPTSADRTEQWKSARDFHLLSARIYNWGVGNNGDIGADPSAPHDRRHHPSWDSALELSLAEVLTEELHHQEKMVLCWHIARAVLDLFATGWLAPDWGITDIVIFGWADGNSRHLDLRHPYLSVDSIDDAAAWLDRAHICSPDLDPVHPFPHILSLGVVLLQVLLGDRLEKLGLGGDEKGDMRRKTDQAHRLRSECELRFPSRWPIMEAANLCIEFRASSWGPASLGSTVATRANLLRAWKNVVSCLERGVLDNQRLPQTNFGLSRFLEESHAPRKSVLGDLEQFMWRLQFIRKHKADVTQDPSADHPIGKTGKTEITLPIITKSPKLTRSLEHSPSLIALANKFLAPLRAISNGLRAIGDRDMDGAFRPDRVWDNMVRVAILDTGCNFSQPLMKGLIVGHNGGDSEIPKTQRRPGIVGWKDFVRGEAAQPGEPLSDTAENQHGSVMTYLFTQTMSHAKLYIGRVMEHASSSDPLTPERVAEAAEYAVNVWKADIISISMAIDATSEHVRERLDAVSRRALVFAAAGNNRGPDRSPIAYPASSGTAICVHSHDGHGKPSEFSPDPQPNAPNFQVIGQDLRVPSLSQSVHGSEEVVQGTSCATAIAAAIGALVLDFARAYAAVETEKQPSLADPEGPKDYMSWILHLLVTKHDLLRKEQVMKQVLYYLMTTASLRAFGKFNMVKPQLLFRVGEPGWIERAAVQLGQELEKVHENRDPQRF